LSVTPPPAPNNKADALKGAKADSKGCNASGVQPCPTVAPTILIENPKTLVVPRDYFTSIPAYKLQPQRLAVRLGVDRSFDGQGKLTAQAEGDRIKLFTKAKGGTEVALPLTLDAKKFNGGYTLYVQGVKPSSGSDSTILKWELSGGSKPKKGPATDKLTCVKLTLELYAARDPANAAAAPAKIGDAQKHDPGRYIHVQSADPLPLGPGDPAHVPADKLPYERAQVTVKPVEPNDWKGTLVLLPCDLEGKPKATRLAIFDAEVPAKSQAAKAAPVEIAHAAGFTAVNLFVQGTDVNKEMRNSPLKLAVKGTVDSSGTVAEGDRAVFTVLKVEMALCQSRSKERKDANDVPTAMTFDDKHKKGRFVHVQFDQHHGRAGLHVKPVKPDAFRGKLELGVWDPAGNTKSTAKVEIFDDEVPAGGQTAKANTFEVTVDDAFQKHGKLFWAQGKATSGALRDAQVRLSLKDHINVCDSGKLTAVQFSELAVDIPSTPAQTNRAGNSPVDRHPFDHAKPPANASFDHDFGTNEPIVLIEDSIRGADLAKLKVKIAPAAAADLVRWHTNRDKRKAAPKGDAAAIVSLPGNTKDPTLVVQDAADKLKATMTAGAVGSFHIHPYIDQNGNNKFDFDSDAGDRIDREPFLCLNLVLVRVEGVRNDSVAQEANASVIPAAPTSATGVRISTGGWNAATTGAYSKATVKVTGGGENGRRGLDQVFSGWGQHIGPTATSASAPPGLDIFARYQRQAPAVGLGPPPAPTMHRKFFVFTRSGAAGTVFGPGAPLVVEAAPVLDVTPLGAGLDGVGGDSCTGQWGGHGSLNPITKTNKTVGQEWVVDTCDSPSVGHGATHPNFPAPIGGWCRMVEFRFNIDFRVDLLFWTNKSKVAVNSADPAARLYSSVQTNNWTVRFALSFNPVTGAAVGAVPAVKIKMTKDGNAKRRSTPVDGMGLETRFPTALDLFSTDASA
jgi:hypothetical protein